MVACSPFGELHLVRNARQRRFEDSNVRPSFMSEEVPTEQGRRAETWAIDLDRTPDHCILRTMLPGAKAEDVDIPCPERTVTIRTTVPAVEHGPDATSGMPLIAVVNDDTAFLQLMEDALRDEGYRVCLHLTTDGVPARIVAEHPDLMILDMVMELRDAGLRLVRAVRDEPELAQLPVIVTSADVAFLREHADELVALRCGIIEKPFDLDRLFARIAAMTRRSGGEAGAA